MDGPFRVAGFLVVVDVSGTRHAVRLGSISAVHDADEARTESVITLQGGRNAILVRHEFEEVLAQIADK